VRFPISLPGSPRCGWCGRAQLQLGRFSREHRLSEEFSSRVAESTRLILVKDGFGGDLGALDRWTDERRKDTKILEWFGPPERNTLRPL
jgi:hypothetical protein